ncbi:PREDICTED: uncharacterized protein LOC109345094 isoform X1 [Lupinus angustifolius]|uniref:uncharacterized protein LOC109345094 isoform X1 n=1 Tax=Lupinus angustifolius TaxID=3871 RepID=UPI00092FC061|nr:PREDICTED: uncharacterized protein LOC109345094 isoform X1 [Lupinus angustifolius]
MEKNNNRKKVGGSSSSSSPTNFDHLFGPKDPSSTSSSSSSLFSSIFPPPSTVGGRDSRKQDNGGRGYGPAGNYGKGESSGGISNKNTSTNYENETVEASYYSSSIYYGGQENYSPRTRTTESHHPHVVPCIINSTLVYELIILSTRMMISYVNLLCVTNTLLL